MKVAQNRIGKAYFFLYNPAWRGLFFFLSFYKIRFGKAYFFSFFFVGPGLDLNSWIKKRLVGKGWREFLFFWPGLERLIFFSFFFVGPGLDLDSWIKKKVSKRKLELIVFFSFFYRIRLRLGFLDKKKRLVGRGWRGLFFFFIISFL